MKIFKKTLAAAAAVTISLANVYFGNLQLLIGKYGTVSAETYGRDYLGIQMIDKDKNGTYDYVKITECFSIPYDYNIEIPSEIDGLPVMAIDDMVFAKHDHLKEVTIPDSVTDLGKGTFYNCTALENVILSNSIKSLDCKKTNDTGMFEGCTSLESITIPNSVTSIGNCAFKNCSALTKVTIPDNITSIGNYAFENCSALTKMTIPNSVTSIGTKVFSGCKSLIDITLPNGTALSMGSGVFSDCTGLTNVTIPKSVASISDSTFFGCTGLTKVTISDSVTSIGNDAFSGCTGLTNITIPDSVSLIDKNVFLNCSNLTSITLSEHVTSIGSMAFNNCKSLTSITIKNPDCKIDGSSGTINNGTDEILHNYIFNGTIYGYKNSTAQEYAKKNKYQFKALDAPAVLQGDVSGNGKIDLTDAILISKFLLDHKTLSQEQQEIADYDGNNKIDLQDIIAISKYLISKTSK